MGIMEPLELEILDSARSLRVFYPKGQYQIEHTPCLVDAGFLRPVQLPTREPGMPPKPIGYAITSQGIAALMAGRISNPPLR